MSTNNQNDAFNDLFSLDSADFVKKQTSKTIEVFAPKAKEGKDNVYKAIIRFVAWHKSPKQSHVEKYIAWMENPMTNEGFYVDCPSSVGKKSVIQDTFFKLYKSEDIMEKNLAKQKFSRKETHYALVQIIKDPNKPENVGKIMVFKFPKQIWTIIASELEPEVGVAMNPFNPMKAKDFLLNIYEKGVYNAYDQSKFVGENKAIDFQLDGINNTYDGSDDSKANFVSWLEKNSPNLDNYRFKEWDEETTKKVVDIISLVVPSQKMVSEVLVANQLSQYSNSKPKAVKEESIDEDYTDLLSSAKSGNASNNTQASIPTNTGSDMYDDL